jgi:hypothetical protein
MSEPLNTELQYHVHGWAEHGREANKGGLVLRMTCRNRAAALAWAAEHNSVFVVDTEVGNRIWLHPSLQPELRAAQADAEARRARAVRTIQRYRRKLVTLGAYDTQFRAKENQA